MVLGSFVFPSQNVLSQSGGENTIFLPIVEKSAFSSHTFYVTTTGKASNDGSAAHPWDLDSALLNTSKVHAGDIIWVRGGTYKPEIESIKFNIKVKGAANNPVIIRAYPGERVTIDGSVEIYSEYVTFWGFEITNTNPDRTSSEVGSHPSDISRGSGVNLLAPNISLINNIIHEGENGISSFSSSPDAIIYGNISFNNGWMGPDRGHGHGLYAQNETGSKTLAENIVFNNFGAYSFHLYTENGSLKNFTLTGNVAMNDTFLIGGTQPVQNIHLFENYVYNTKSKLGYSNQNNTNLQLQQNWFWNPSGTGIEINWWNNFTVMDNYILSGSSPVLTYEPSSSPGPVNWTNNNYQAGSDTDSFTYDGDQLSWNQWRSTTTYDSGSQFSTAPLTDPSVFVRPNQYEKKRGNIIIFNWSDLNEINADISSLGLASGDLYTLHNAQNYYAETIQGTYNDSNPTITIPMTGWSVAKPIGWSVPLNPSTFPKFGVFVLTVP